MKLEEELRLYKESRSIQAREICRKRTIEQSKKVFYAEEQKRILSGTNFYIPSLDISENDGGCYRPCF
ncbi:MAG: hypothetical protein ACLT4D_14195 [Blautia faecis]